MQVIAGEEPWGNWSGTAQANCEKRQKTTSKPKKLTKEDYCGQFFKIPNRTASKGKSVYVRQEHHETFNRLTNIMGIDKLTIYAYLDNIIEYHFQEFGNWLAKSITKSTSRCFDSGTVSGRGAFLPLKIIFQKKKKESHFNKADRRKNQKETE
jgi:hypothetical protein